LHEARPYFVAGEDERVRDQLDNLLVQMRAVAAAEDHISGTSSETDEEEGEEEGDEKRRPRGTTTV
jgi:hypothetical protein